MATNLGWLVSRGFKRKLASLLAIVAQLAQTVPGLGQVLVVLNYIAGLFGVAGVAHAAGSGTVTKFGAASIASVLAALLAAAQIYPALLPFVPIIQKLVLIFGVLGIAKK